MRVTATSASGGLVARSVCRRSCQRTGLAVTGPVVVQEITTEDRTSVQRFCSTCHSRLYNTNTRRPGVVVVRAGTLDRSEELDCVAHIFTAYRQRWVVIPTDMPSWPEAPPPADLVRALTA